MAQKSNEQIDDTIEDSFPASDPASHSGITGAGHQHAPKAKGSTNTSEQGNPKGQPTSDRHLTETAHHDQTSDT